MKNYEPIKKIVGRYLDLKFKNAIRWNDGVWDRFGIQDDETSFLYDENRTLYADGALINSLEEILNQGFKPLISQAMIEWVEKKFDVDVQNIM